MLIRLVDVVKVFQTGKRQIVALDGITMDVRDGEFLGVVGPSGCGKSTLLALIAGLEAPTAGSIRFIGEQRAQTRTAMVWQDYRLLPWRVVERNVGIGPEFRRCPEEERQSIVSRLLRKVRLQGFEQFFPGQLSGGMKQRAGIARALANDPEVLLMDEPFAHLDALNRRMMQLELLTLWEQTHKTVVYVTHSIDEAVLLSDRVVVMTASPGRIKDFVDIELPRPRTADMMALPAFGAATQRIWRLLEDEVRRAGEAQARRGEAASDHKRVSRRMPGLDGPPPRW
jgi:NitT/TauT family transport system ATP-binding protein